MLNLVKPMVVYGTTTSPFVRRLRVVCEVLSIAYELVDTFSDSGQAHMRTLNPIWKVPTAELTFDDANGRRSVVLWDSMNIIEFLLASVKTHPFRVTHETAEAALERNMLHAIDGALESGIQVFYAKREGVDMHLPYQVKQRERTAHAFAWLDSECEKNPFLADSTVGMTELTLVCAYDWLRFREMYDPSVHPRVRALYEKMHTGLWADALNRTRPRLSA